MASENLNKKQRAQPLRRGKACLNCRHLKIKCDGARPVCGQCTRVPKEDPCEFTDTMSRTQELESTVQRLQFRLNELQGVTGPSNHGHGGRYRQASDARSSPFSGSSGSDASPTFPSFNSRPHSAPSSDSSFLDFQEPPLVVIQMLLQTFLPHATQFGFFLHPQRFSDAALLPLPFGDERRPSPALLCVVYLYGVHLSQSQPLLASEPVFLKRAQQNISTELSVHTHPMHILHTIQAQVLLSSYLFRTKRFLEAEFYANGAATLALGYQFHKIRSARPGTPPLLGVPVLLEVYPTPPADAIEEGERIRAFWAVACLQSNLNIALNAASGAFCILESPGTEIDTPWPLELADYEAGAIPPGYSGQESIRHFLTDDPLPPSPACMLHAKASVLLYRAARLGARWSPTFQPQERAAYATSYTWLDRRITQFWESLPPIYTFYTASASASARTVVLAHALTAAAAIKLNHSAAASGSSVDAQAKCVDATRAILAIFGDEAVRDRVTAHPVVGSLMTMACRVLMDEVRRARAFRTTWAAGVGSALPPPSKEEVSFVEEVRAGMGTMAVYAVGCPLIEYQLRKLRQQYDTM
ncbi:Zn(2)-Cys(6) binuclear cluster domain-containing protein [Mycena alexandri]|uniref:Zn(2)-Cys(6) binuclear cluster domain-containing protein n=1 Tax=Mycena alexandri TaxID=1745969 RepID=A0AAD6WZ75_9AGAR|nr:Zn(2)-Cys(6) binuclear cluster domain-containing protein [Mycena alexandri]